ncbi:hypothetical protein TSA1_13435 [Bradyrhizobium nitroreducens]|uniref:Uncharacterized protein n=1 Tax=Bradyrhizobium nitroreducens TaxID=709803 RepID=A0A2M6UAQ0_9BRAD|nr:hypothetical protein [Bradyrhizobium nitroreducens]PIT01665.1 hypothetical protein TSA1_13435 [Bradyrhizobium nitroreducens]
MTFRPPKPAPRRVKATPTAEIEPQSYAAFVSDLKQKIAEARHRALEPSQIDLSYLGPDDLWVAPQP